MLGFQIGLLIQLRGSSTISASLFEHRELEGVLYEFSGTPGRYSVIAGLLASHYRLLTPTSSPLANLDIQPPCLALGTAKESESRNGN